MKLNNQYGSSGLKNFLIKKKSNFFFIITGKKSFKKSNFYNLFLKNYKKNFFIYYKDNTNYCHTNELKKIIKKINVYNPDLILAIGGGTVIDYAKMASVIWKSNNKNIKFRSKNILEKKYLTSIIPTTAGSGSEVTSFTSLYEKNKKFSIESSLLLPDYFFLVPELLLNSPRKVRAASGFDAISQSIESIFSKKSNHFSLKYSLKSLNYSLKNFLNFVTEI